MEGEGGGAGGGGRGAGDGAVGGAGGQGRGAKGPTPAPLPFLRGNHTQSIEKHVNRIPWNQHCPLSNDWLKMRGWNRHC
jgi:hypothetical protein